MTIIKIVTLAALIEYRFRFDLVYFCVSICFLAILPAQASSQETLNILNWDDYIASSVIEEWQEKTGAKVHIITYDDEEIRDVLLADGSQHQVDLAVVDANSAKKLTSLGHVAELEGWDTQAAPSLMRTDWIEQCGDRSVPYLWGTYGIAYRTDMLNEPVSSWSDLFSQRQDMSGHIGMISDYYSLLAPALLTLQLQADSNERKDLEAAFGLLKEQTDQVLTYEYAPSFLLNSKRKADLYAAIVYSGDQYTMNELVGEDVWQYVIPKEGALVWLDCWIIPSRSQKRDLAMSFLAHIGQPNVAAINSEELGVATVDVNAYHLQSQAFREDPLVYLSETDFNSLLPFAPMSDLQIRQRIRIQEAIKVIHESK
ncbi:spermidine/putrescine ABC transporter substrate-binding protein [Marinomonas hwangdonensis]|uniref:Spermidine/putrescine ABC transporter substrate-binding protein n=1 Tax=Marinomonas hwangdonensis TaxID=1053647 RepID=A0A3M8Q4S8_9GAMM|nr:spermidine/putrescine ABC transporter substrate-binding protein [Marinomonas hwangdonensis]RNF51117.1 spermidine/putrescine ABC transporter substrate-binding protein [Marinomonas hwangdonensis]